MWPSAVKPSWSSCALCLPQIKSEHNGGATRPRCQRITVSGLTIASASRTFGNNQWRLVNINRSMLLEAGLLRAVRRRMLICWRSTKFSASSAALYRNSPVIVHQMSVQRSLTPAIILDLCGPQIFSRSRLSDTQVLSSLNSRFALSAKNKAMALFAGAQPPTGESDRAPSM
jgi:hypothetical protein